MFAPIKKIDQIYARTQSIGDVNKFYYLFANVFAFPEAWAPKDRKTYYGGGVYTGNTWLKWTTVNLRNYHMTDKPAEFNTILAEPTEYGNSMIEINRRGIKHNPERVQTSLGPTGQENEWCKSVSLGESPFSDIGLSVVKYTPFAFPEHTSTPDASNLREHYRILRSRLDDIAGGPLGLRYVKEVELGVKDVAESMARWQVLLNPIRPLGEDSWRIGSGPNLRLTPSSENTIKSISFKVRSLTRAKRFLKSYGLLGEASGDMVSLDHAKVNDLDIRFVK